MYLQAQNINVNQSRYDSCFQHIFITNKTITLTAFYAMVMQMVYWQVTYNILRKEKNQKLSTLGEKELIDARFLYKSIK